VQEYQSLELQTLPSPSAELVLYRVHVEALIHVLGRKKAGRYLRAMADKLAWEEGLASVFQIRPASEQASVRQARQQAAAIFERMLPIFLAALPPR
jgi:hypothetical protein